MTTSLLQILQQISSSPGMQKMAAIDKKAKELGINDADAIAEYVQAVCRLVTSNLDRTDKTRELVLAVFDAAVEAGPDILQIMADHRSLLSALIAGQPGQGGAHE